MKARYYPWAIAGGLCVVALPGSELWMVPAGLAVAHMVYDAAPEAFHAQGRRLLAAAERLQLPGASNLLPTQDARQVDDRTRAMRLPVAESPQFVDDRTRVMYRPPTQGAAATLPPRQWLQAVNDRPDDNPHLTVVGPSGSGKTTFVSAALNKRPGRVVVLTPKVSPAAWRGAEVVSLSDDLTYDPIADALVDLQTEARRRAKALQRGEPLEPLTVVLDELPELHAEVKGLGMFAVRLSRWGRELNMRQVVIATSDDALNIPGWAATRPNYARVELQKPLADGTRPAWLDDGQSRRRLDLGNVKAGAEGAQLQPWRASKSVVAEAPAPATPARLPVDFVLLDAMLAQSVPSRQDAEGTAGVPVPVPGNGNRNTARSQVTLTRGNAPGLTVNVDARAVAAGAGRRVARGRGINVKARRLAAAYRKAGAEGVPFRKMFAELGGSKDDVFPAWQEGRKSREGTK